MAVAIVFLGPGMFTGIIESRGTIVASRANANGRVLGVEVAGTADKVSWAADCKLGASIAVSGVCLTITNINGNQLEFDVIQETLAKTTLGDKHPGSIVNLERALAAGDRLDGHFVQGHCDGTAVVDRVISNAREWVIWLKPEAHLRPYIIPKGSVAIEGVSLTVAAVEKDRFSVALIPTTLDVTTLSALKDRDRVNIESDMIARTIVHHLSYLGDGGGASARGISMNTLREAGFA
jgi:riboflavin synthase